MIELIDLLRIVTDFGLVVLIWLVQLIIYPSFRHSDVIAFEDWHSRYTNLIGLFVVPLMFTQVGIVAYQTIENTGLENTLSSLLVGSVWLVTFTISAPLHGQLTGKGRDLPTIERLIATNWLRTVAWTVVFLLGLFNALT